jgi:hypothetical protein
MTYALFKLKESTFIGRKRAVRQRLAPRLACNETANREIGVPGEIKKTADHSRLRASKPLVKNDPYYYLLSIVANELWEVQGNLLTIEIPRGREKLWRDTGGTIVDARENPR